MGLHCPYQRRLPEHQRPERLPEHQRPEQCGWRWPVLGRTKTLLVSSY
ncbi:hypothetical protein LINGRAHAP2_LOCUS9687 [Linum grandiflorum]